MTDARIDSIMQTDIIRLRADTPIREAAARLVEGRAAAAYVVDEGDALLGTLTQKDCFRPALNASYYRQWRGTVADHMSREVVALEADTDFVTAAQMFLDNPYRVYPVVRDGNLVGLLRRSDLLRVFLDFG